MHDYTKEEWERLSRVLISEINSIAIGLANWTFGELDKNIEEKFKHIKNYFVNKWLSGLLPDSILFGINFIELSPENYIEQLFNKLFNNLKKLRNVKV